MATSNFTITKTNLARFWANIQTTESCWIWVGTRACRGYGAISIDRKRWRAHRLSWAIHNGTIPDGLYICHRCDNPPCVNPEHLFAGTQKDNIADCVRKGRFSRSIGERTRNNRRRRGFHRTKAIGHDHYNSKLTLENVLEIRSTPPKWGEQSRLARKFGVTKSSIRDVLSRRCWGHV